MAQAQPALEGILKDVLHALRVLRRSPGFTAAVALSLALGIGANTAIFSLIDAVMWRMLPVHNPQSLWVVGDGFTYQQYRAMQAGSRLASVAGYSPARLSVSIDGAIEPAIEGHLVSGGYFGLLGISPLAGRTIGPDDDRVPNGHPVAMISEGYWRRRFGGAPSVIGKTISISGAPFTIIGVTPREFFGLEVGSSPDLYVPVMMQPAVMPAYENLLDRPIIYRTWLQMVARLNTGVRPEHAVSDQEPIWRQEMPAGMGGKFSGLPQQRLDLKPAATGLSRLRKQFSQPLFILMAVVGIVLLIACANTANLLLARAAARQPELAVRLALGASRGRVIRQLLVESMLLALIGGALGVLLARWMTQILVGYMSAGRAPISLDLQPDLRILGFTALVSIATGILFGLAPAMRATRIDLAPSMKKLGGRLSSGGLRPGKVLAVAQVSLSLVLLAGAGLFVRSLQKLNSQDSGFQRQQILIMRVEPRGSDQRNLPGTSERLDRTYRGLLDRVGRIPGVRAATMAQFTPTNPVTLGSPVRFPSGDEMRVSTLMVYPNYFRTLMLPVLTGRDFDDRDLDASSPLVAVVNEAFAKLAFPGEHPVGKLFMAGRFQTRIIGVVKDSRYSSLRGETPPLVYQTFLQTRTGRGQMSLHARVSGEAGVMAQRIREEVHKLDSTIPLFEVRTLAEEVDAALIQERMIALLSGCFSTLAVILACIGLHGLIAFGVVQRTGEMGIRLALGARRGDVTWMVMKEALVLVGMGVALGAPAAIAVARLASNRISGLVFGLPAADPVSISGAAAVLALAAALAAYVPARRASGVNPVIALRNE